jgi:hypothetical protein
MMAVRRAAFMPPVTPASTRAPLRPRSRSPRLRNSTSSRSLQGRREWSILRVRSVLVEQQQGWHRCIGSLLPSSQVSQQVQRNSVTAGHRSSGGSSISAPLGYLAQWFRCKQIAPQLQWIACADPPVLCLGATSTKVGGTCKMGRWVLYDSRKKTPALADAVPQEPSLWAYNRALLTRQGHCSGCSSGAGRSGRMTPGCCTPRCSCRALKPPAAIHTCHDK